MYKSIKYHDNIVFIMHERRHAEDVFLIIWQTCFVPHRMVAWQASLAACCLAHSCGTKTTDPSHDMQAVIHSKQNIH